MWGWLRIRGWGGRGSDPGILDRFRDENGVLRGREGSDGTQVTGEWEIGDGRCGSGDGRWEMG